MQLAQFCFFLWEAWGVGLEPDVKRLPRRDKWPGPGGSTGASEEEDGDDGKFASEAVRFLESLPPLLQQKTRDFPYARHNQQ